MEITYLKEPFEHFIFKDFFDEQQLKEVWTELDFFVDNDLVVSKDYEPENLGTSIDADLNNPKVFNQYKAKRHGLFLHNTFFNFRAQSKIYNHIKTNFFQNDQIRNNPKSTLATYIKYTNSDAVLISMYREGDYYKPHPDLMLGTFIIYLWKGPKTFSGGNLIFRDFDYTYNCDYNTAILFPSCHTHEVDTIISTAPTSHPYKRIAITLFSTINDK